MKEDSAFTTSAAAVAAPFQRDCFRLAYNTKEEAGRHVVAQRPISPGELVLAAAPYGLVMNPSYCPSALYLSSKAIPHEVVGTLSNAADGKAKTDAGAPRRTLHSGGKKASKGSASAHQVSRGDPEPASVYTHALQRTYGSPAASNSIVEVEERWYTAVPTWCSVCLREIPAGRWLCNRGSLAELAMDISQEQEDLQKTMTEMEDRAATADAAARVYADEVEHFEDGGCDRPNGAAATASAAAAAADTAFQKLKKPTKSSKTRKDGAVELKQRLVEKALAFRDELLLERRLQRRQRVARGEPEVRQEGWEAPVGSALHAAAVEEGSNAVWGCSGCGVLCFCTKTCWHAHRHLHKDSGECDALRVLYPRLMADYYAIGGAGTTAGGSRRGHAAAVGLGAVWMPGDEPLRWARSTSEQKMLEFQSLLFSAVVVARLCRAGYGSHLARLPCSITAKAREAVHKGEEEDERLENPFMPPVSMPSVVVANAYSSAITTAEVSPSSSLLPASPDGTATSSSSPPPATNAFVDSSVVPKEVHTILEQRSRAGLTGVVEVLDGDPALRALAQVLATKMVDAIGETDAAAPSESTGVGDSEGTAQDPERSALARVPQPRYADLAQMETNWSVISKQRRSTYQRYYRMFSKRVLPLLQLLLLRAEERGGGVARVGEAAGPSPAAPSDTAASTLLDVSEDFFQRLCAAAQCNSFGVYDTQDHCIGFGIYPAASYFNHSCAPNLCRVMHHGHRVAAFYALRPIAPNDPLTICYTDVEESNSAERRRNLLETYRFFCGCERCSGAAEAPTMAVGHVIPSEMVDARDFVADCPRYVEVSPAMFEQPLLLCTACSIRGYLRPLIPTPVPSSSPPSTSPWGMAEVRVRECTVCRCRAVRGR